MGLLTTMTICKNCGNGIEGRKDVIFLGLIINEVLYHLDNRCCYFPEPKQEVTSNSSPE